MYREIRVHILTVDRTIAEICNTLGNHQKVFCIRTGGKRYENITEANRLTLSPIGTNHTQFIEYKPQKEIHLI